jgi:hypothetical protein
VLVFFLRETITDPSESTWFAKTLGERPADATYLWDNPRASEIPAAGTHDTGDAMYISADDTAVFLAKSISTL